jgi:hypothetical protein
LCCRVCSVDEGSDPFDVDLSLLSGGSVLLLSGSFGSLCPVFPPLSLAGGQVLTNKIRTQGKWKEGIPGKEV